MDVSHGSRVEHSEDWLFEGAWAGDFASGDFDQPHADVVIGTGLRVRGDTVSFVCSTSPVDRLYFVTRLDHLVVSNSLACLLAVTGLRLDPQFPYSKALCRFLKRHRQHPKTVPTLEGIEINVLSYDILTFARNEVAVSFRPAEPAFASFEDYERLLDSAIEAIRANISSDDRSHEIVTRATMSRGYDSPAATVIAKALSIRSVLTISRIGTFSQYDDSGKNIAKMLGISAQCVVSRPSRYRDHDLIWAGLGRPDDLNMTLFAYPDDLMLLITGIHGGNVWDRHLRQGRTHAQHFLDREADGCGMNEWRLHKGVFIASIPCIGASRLDCMKRVNESLEMRPWRVGGRYDRPVPRRIVEQQGVGRDEFGQTKRATIAKFPRYYPHDRGLQADLEEFLLRHGRRLPRRLGVFTEAVHVARAKVSRAARKGKWPRIARVAQLPDLDDLVFVWANQRLANEVYSPD